jgi:hypothetical protein
MRLNIGKRGDGGMVNRDDHDLPPLLYKYSVHTQFLTIKATWPEQGSPKKGDRTQKLFLG